MWRYTEDGQKVRVSKRSGRILPISDEAYATIDYAKKSVYERKEKKVFFWLF